MNAFFDYLEHLKGQPHPVRRRIATISAAGAAAFIGLLWFGTSLATGGYALRGASFAQSTLEAPAAPASQLACAAAADAAANTPAHIEVVDVASSTPRAPTEPTVIPF